MITILSLVLLLISSCNVLSFIYNISPKEVRKSKQDDRKIRLEPDEYDISKESSERFKDWYSSLIDGLSHAIDPKIVIFDIYDCLEEYGKLPFLGRCGKKAVEQAEKVWEQGKQVFGRETKPFSYGEESLDLDASSWFVSLPQSCRKDYLNMILDLAGNKLLKESEYIRLSERFDDLEQSLSQVNQSTYNALIHLKKLCIDYFDEINRSKIDRPEFYSGTYPGLIYFMLTLSSSQPLGWYSQRQDQLVKFVLFAIFSGPEPILSDFLDFLDKNREITSETRASFLACARFFNEQQGYK